MGRLSLILAVILLLAAPVSAASAEEANGTEGIALPDFGAASLPEGLTEEQRERMGDPDPLDPPDLWQTVSDMISSAVRGAGGTVRQAAAQSAMLLSVCLLCGICAPVEEGASRAAAMTGVLAVLTICTEAVGGMIRLGTDTVRELAAFSQLFLPVLAAASAASGAVTSAPAVCGVTVLISDLLLACLSRFLIPGIYLFLAMNAADCALGQKTVKGLAALIGWAIRTALKWILYGFTAFLTLTQVISGTADAMTAKAAKLTLSGMVPVVGSILSDASETLLISASMIRNSIGVYGLLAILAVCIVPFLQIAVRSLFLRLTAAMAAMVGQDAPVRMIGAVAEAMSLLLAMTGTAALLTIISVVCSLRLAGGQ